MAATAINLPSIAHDGDSIEGDLSLDGFAHVDPKFFSRYSGPSDKDDLTSSPRRSVSSGEASSVSSASNSEEDYDALEIDPSTVVPGGRGGGLHAETTTLDSPLVADEEHGSKGDHTQEQRRPPNHRRTSIPITIQTTGKRGRYLLKADDPELKEILSRSIQREALEKLQKRRSRFSDLVFTRQFTAFDRQNPASASSAFHGFFTLFWLGVFLLLVKVAADNWKRYGSIFGHNEILTMMFHKDVLVLGITDGVLCGSTVFCLLLQKAIRADYLSWNKQGWIIQNIWQALYLAGTIRWTIFREWPWSHTVFITLHCIAMLMKQHSYAFYNGYLSELYSQKRSLERKLEQLDNLDPVSAVTSPSSTAYGTSYFELRDLHSIHRRRRSIHAKSMPHLDEEPDLASAASAIESGITLDLDQIQNFERIIQLEIDNLNEELNGKCSTTANQYPANLNIRDFASYIPLPTLVYELEYPRQDSINWSYVAEKTAATFGVLAVMLVISQAFIYPVVITTVEMKEHGLSLSARLDELPWILSELLFPFMMEYLLAWYVIWECILNVLAELTRFADRGFYADWWNSVSWDQFARDWNRPVHNFLLRHVYHSSISAFRISRSSATLITFLLSACVHELAMWCIFKKLRGYLMIMQMMQLPLVGLSRSRLLRGRKVLGNVVFWVGIFTGPSFLCSLYLIL